MKTRNGFVSNSSSSSFTCNICGENSSGMDMGLSEAGMQECINGHTICDCHERTVKLSTQEKLDFLIALVKKRTWRSAEDIQKDIAELQSYNESKIEDKYTDNLWDGGPECRCPICMFEELDWEEALSYILKNNHQTPKQLAAVIGAEFKTYDAFKTYITPPKEIKPT